MNRIIIFTKLFPFAKTEAFLESEIEVLRNYFDEIIFCPTYKNDYTRKIPQNAKINLTFAVNYRRFIYAVLLAIIKGNFVSSLYYHKNKINSLKDILTVFKYSIFDVYYEMAFKKKEIDFNNSILYSYWFNPRVNSIIRIIDKYKLNCKIITRAHRWDIYETKSLQFPYRAKNIQKLDKIISISLDGKKYLDKNYDTNNKVVVSRLGVFDKGHLNLGSESGAVHIVSVSQVTERKRVFLAFESISEFAKSNSNLNVKWTHFGIGDLFDQLKNQVENQKLQNLTISLKGYVKNTDIYKFYENEKIDFFINLSESEGIPVSIMEAQSFGIPVIATNVGGTKEIVNNDVGSLLSPNPDLNEVVNAINIVLQKGIARKAIKDSWNKLSNAQKNFTDFAKIIRNL